MSKSMPEESGNESQNPMATYFQGVEEEPDLSSLDDEQLVKELLKVRYIYSSLCCRARCLIRELAGDESESDRGDSDYNSLAMGEIQGKLEKYFSSLIKEVGRRYGIEAGRISTMQTEVIEEIDW